MTGVCQRPSPIARCVPSTMHAVGQKGRLHVEGPAMTTCHAACCATLLSAPAPLLASATRSITTEGVTFAGDIRLAGTALVLNGVGLRAVAWLKGYAAGLYLPKKAGTEAQVLRRRARSDCRCAWCTRSSQRVRQGLRQGHRSATRRRRRPSSPSAWCSSTRIVRAGQAEEAGRDRPRLPPRQGPGAVAQRRAARRAVPGEDLYAALLRCFIGVRPADADMKVGLLGGPVG